MRWPASIPGANLAPELCRQQPVDLILMDVQTENRENGLSAAAQIKKEHPRIKIVIVTSLLDAEVLRQAKLLGTDCLWYKDGSQEKLMEIVRQTLSGEHIFPDAPPVTQIGTAEKQRVYRSGNARAALSGAGYVLHNDSGDTRRRRTDGQIPCEQYAPEDEL